MLQKSLESQEALARAEQNKLVSEFTEKNNNTQERKLISGAFILMPKTCLS